MTAQTKKKVIWIVAAIALVVVVAAVTIPCVLLSLASPQTVEDIMRQPTDGFTATGYTDAYGNTIEGLEGAVEGKQYWLADDSAFIASAKSDGGSVVLDNGIVRRKFNVPASAEDKFYTSEFRNIYIEKDLIDGIAPECIIGLYAKPYSQIYLPKTELNTSENDRSLILENYDECFVGGNEDGNMFAYKDYTIYDTCEGRFTYRPESPWSDPAAGEYPSKGKRVEFSFAAVEGAGCDAAFAAKYKDLEVKLVYEIYDGVPVIKKRVDFVNHGESVVTIGRLVTELLDTNGDGGTLLELETTYVCGDDTTVSFNSSLPCDCAGEASDSAMKRYADFKHTCYDLGPAYQLDKGAGFQSFDTYEYAYSTYWFEQQSKERLAIYRVLFPWVLDNPLTFHSTKKLSKSVIDHVAKAGFEMVIQSFGVSDDSKAMLTTKQKKLDKWKELVDYAHSKGVGVGVYQAQYQQNQYKSSAAYGKNDIGQWGTWCVASTAYEDYYRDFIDFLEYTGVDCVEIDGPYPNCACNNGEAHEDTSHSSHALHNGYFDSKVKQWENGVRELTAKLRSLGVYVKTPAWYYMSGSNKCGIGYEEVAWSQSRKEQLIYGRQILHNGSYVRTASMSWTFMPLGVYHGGGLSASFKPYVCNQFDYDWAMGQNLGNGLTSDFRGKTLYDFATLKTVQKWSAFFKQHRSIINADIVHVKQAEFYSDKDRKLTSSLDAVMHAGSGLDGEKGLLWVYNQSKLRRKCVLNVPMFYTGLTDFSYPTPPVYGSTGKAVRVYGEYPPNYSWLPKDMPDYRLPELTDVSSGSAEVIDAEGNSSRMEIDSNGNITLQFTMEPMTYTYFIFKA